MTGAAWEQIECGRQRWWVAPAWRDRLLGGDGLRLAEWEQQGRVQVVKHSVNRTVYRVGLPGQAVFVKHYPVDDWRSRVRRWLRPAKALREWRQAVRLRREAVPTITPLAVGVRADGASYFVSEALEGAVGLYPYVQAHAQQWSLRERREVLADLGRFVARLYQRGITHRDLHGENILVRCDAVGQREWFLIDPYEAAGGTKTVQALRTSLALLGMAFWPDLSPADRCRFWRAFRNECGDSLRLSRSAERAVLRDVATEVWRRTQAVWSKRASRCLGTNRDFYCLRDSGSTAWSSRSLPEAWWRDILRDPDGPLRETATRILKTSRHGLVALIRGPAGEPLIYKRFDTQGLIGRWRESAALRSYRMAYRLELGRVPTARPLAVLETAGTSYLVTEYERDAEGLIEFVERRRANGDWQALRAFAGRLARAVRRMHDFRRSHRDLKSVNLLVREERPVFVDLRGVRYQRWLGQSRRQKDLARLALSATITLHLSRTERLRFLLRYLGDERVTWRDWWRAIANLCRRKVARNTRRERVVS